MRFLIRLLICCLAPGAGLAVTSLENARRAQSMLGVGAWSHVVEVTNTSPGNAYPAIVHALVFEEGGLLWFYTDTEGTQSLSLYSNRLEQEKADLGPLLQAIDAGFTRFTLLADVPAEPAFARAGSLPNGCFIECIAALRERILLGEAIARPRLLSCYATTRRGLRGHTVLTYLTPQGFFLIDPARPLRPKLMPTSLVENPEGVAGIALEGARVLKARWVPVSIGATTILAKMNPSPSTLSAESATPRLMQ